MSTHSNPAIAHSGCVLTQPTVVVVGLGSLPDTQLVLGLECVDTGLEVG